MNGPRFLPKVSTANVRTIVAFSLIALVVTALAYQVPAAAALDIGSGRDTPFVRGFSFRERFEGGAFRWTTGAGEIRFWGIGAQDGTLALRLSVPEQNRAAGVQVWANEQLVGTAQPAPGFNELSFPVNRADLGARGDLSVRIVSATFSVPPDVRALGVQVDSAAFRGSGSPILPAPRALLYVPALVALAFVVGQLWSGRWSAGVGASIVTLAGLAYGLTAARVETAYFVEPLFWSSLVLCGGALLLVAGMVRLTRAMNAPALGSRTVRWVLLVMTAALILRMVFAVEPGYIVDVQDYVVWSYKTVTYGLGSMYAAVEGLWISDQSPGLNYILHGMGLVYQGIFAPDFLYPGVAGDPALQGVTDNPALLADPVHRTLLRLPMLLADVVTGALIFAAARKYVSERGAWLTACAFWFNPVVLWNGAYWGQTDAIHALAVLVSFLLVVFTPRAGLGFFVFGIAAFTKPQALIFGPLLLLAVYCGAAAPGETRYGIHPQALQRAARALVFGALGAGLLLAPVLLTGGGGGLLAYLGDAVGHHPTLSANAHNLWWFVFHDDVDLPDTAAIFPGAPLSYRTFSILLFGVFYLITLLRAWRAPLDEYFALGAFVAFAFFMLPTEIHENYGYALLPLLAVALTRDRALIAFFVAVSVTMTLNYALHDPPLYELLRLSDPHAQLALPRRLDAAVNLVILGAWTVYLFAESWSAAKGYAGKLRGTLS